MNTYFSTCISGLAEVAADELQKTIKDVIIKHVSDGFLIFATNEPVESVIHLRFLNNTFSLVKTFKNIDGSEKSINKAIKQTLDDKNVFYHLTRKLPDKKLRFRIIISRENQMIGMNKDVLSLLEARILENKKLTLHKTLPDVEFWYVIRREGDAYFGIRLTKHTEYAKLLERGQLRPELAHLMSFITNPKASDIVLDPFCGSGAIPIERSIAFPYSEVIAGDYESSCIDSLHKKKLQKPIQIVKLNALDMKLFESNSVTTIITDPPWGISVGLELDLEVFYRDMLKEFYRILKKNGTVVILIGKKDIFDAILENASDIFILIKRYDILLSGQKSGIYTLKKI